MIGVFPIYSRRYTVNRFSLQPEQTYFSSMWKAVRIILDSDLKLALWSQGRTKQNKTHIVLLSCCESPCQACNSNLQSGWQVFSDTYVIRHLRYIKRHHAAVSGKKTFVFTQTRRLCATWFMLATSVT